MKRYILASLMFVVLAINLPYAKIRTIIWMIRRNIYSDDLLAGILTKFLLSGILGRMAIRIGRSFDLSSTDMYEGFYTGMKDAIDELVAKHS